MRGGRSLRCDCENHSVCFRCECMRPHLHTRVRWWQRARRGSRRTSERCSDLQRVSRSSARAGGERSKEAKRRRGPALDLRSRLGDHLTAHVAHVERGEQLPVVPRPQRIDFALHIRHLPPRGEDHGVVLAVPHAELELPEPLLQRRLLGRLLQGAVERLDESGNGQRRVRDADRHRLVRGEAEPAGRLRDRGEARGRRVRVGGGGRDAARGGDPRAVAEQRGRELHGAVVDGASPARAAVGRRAGARHERGRQPRASRVPLPLVGVTGAVYGADGGVHARQLGYLRRRRRRALEPRVRTRRGRRLLHRHRDVRCCHVDCKRCLRLQD
mmetsp:Transcript_12101/g.37654  ORF Transcript_12101/g.37654 Transcript_12101/m.37654 type:complete len:328 (-) Transcript_12101:164-1147(-)